MYHETGLDLPALLAHVRQEPARWPASPAATSLDRDALLELPCDVLVPAAAGSQITAETPAASRRTIVAEGANGPTTPEADEILQQRGILVVPDILCNAGGVFVSYLEYTQETQQEQMTEAEVLSRLQLRMQEKFALVMGTARERRLHPRQAAMLLAVRNVASAIVARGALP